MHAAISLDTRLGKLAFPVQLLSVLLFLLLHFRLRTNQGLTHFKRVDVCLFPGRRSFSLDD